MTSILQRLRNLWKLSESGMYTKEPTVWELKKPLTKEEIETMKIPAQFITKKKDLDVLNELNK